VAAPEIAAPDQPAHVMAVHSSAPLDSQRPVFITEVTLRRDPRADKTAYPFSIPAVRHLERLAFTSPVTFFVGENGSGKSTLLEGIAGAFGLNPEGGTKHRCADPDAAGANRLLLSAGGDIL
jgi:predicted ATPase